MKKVLILAYDFPPFVSVGGLRPFNWYKYMKEFDVEPIVVTRQFSAEFGDTRDYIAASEQDTTVVEKTEYGTIIRSPYRPNFANRLFLKYGTSKFRLVRKMYTAFFEIAQFLWICGPKKEIYKAADAYLATNKVDAIIATGDPFVLFSFAAKLSKKYNVKWIADYRDPWSHNKGSQINAIYHFWLRLIEKKIVYSSNYIVTVSKIFKAKIGKMFPDKEIFIFPNGFDPEVIEKNAEIPQNNEILTISFVGTIYDWHPWQSVLQAIADVLIISPENKMKFNFYGINIPDQVTDFISKFPEKVQQAIEIHPKCPNMELMEKLAHDNVTLLFNYYSFMGTKIFDYVGSKRKIILCYSNDMEALELKEKYYTIDDEDGFTDQVQANLLTETNAGVVVENQDHLKTVLWDLLDEFKSTGQIACNSHGTENYSRKIQVQKLAELIHNLE